MYQPQSKHSIQRILKSDGRAVIVAFDHARMNGLYPGTENPAEVIEAVIEGGADGIMTSYGVIKQFSGLINGRLSKILRLDTGPSRFQETWENYTEWYKVFSVEDAVRLGADGVITFGFTGIEVDGRCLRIIGEVAAEADKYNMPFIAEMHACPNSNYPNNYSPDIVGSVARIGAEFGADLIKTDYTGDEVSFRTVTSLCTVPVLIAGGRKTETTRDTLTMVKATINAGGVGVFLGRNIWRDEDPSAVTRAIVEVVHQNASVDEALKIYEQSKKKRKV